MSLCGWIVFGFLAGLIARALMPGTQAMGFIRTTVLGVAGSFVGGFIASLFSHGDPMRFQPSSFIGSVAGAFVLLLINGMVARRR